MKKKILILGAGFAGIRCAQDLVKKLSPETAEITLVERNPYHLFHPDLYEIATAFNEEITKKCLSKLSDAISIPLKDLIDGRRVKLIQNEIISIDPAARKVGLKGKILKYDYLLVALGSETNYFGIPGMEKYSFPMKNLPDALKINCHLDQFFHSLYSKGRTGGDVHINIGGGGATGVEAAAELVGSLKRLCEKYHYPFERVHLSLIEGGDSLAALNRTGTKVVTRRLNQLGVKIYFNHYIGKVEKKSLYFKGEGAIPSDVLIWTGGVMVNKLVQKFLGTSKLRGAIEVNHFLQSKSDPRIFAAGDNAFYSKQAGMFAQVAYKQGACVADNLVSLVKGKGALRPFKFEHEHYLLPLGGTYAIWRFRGRIFSGTWVWALRRLVFFRYALTILPLRKSLVKLFKGTKIFVQNDIEN